MAMRSAHGFTLPELLAFIAAVGLLLGASFVFAHPHDYARSNRDAQRLLDVAQLTQALNRYYADHGELPHGLTEKANLVANGEGFVDICADLVPRYLKDLPLDPQQSLEVSGGDGTCVSTDKKKAAYTTGYTVQFSRGTVTVAAPYAEGKETVSISRRY